MCLTVPFHPLWFTGYMDISAKLFGRKRMSRCLPGAEDTRVQPRQAKVAEGAVDSDKSFIPCYAFPYGIGMYEALFIPGPPCSPFPVPKNYSLGRNLVVVAVTRKQTKGLILLRPCLVCHEVRGRQGQLPGDSVYLKNNKDSFLGMGLAHAQRTRQTPFFINTFQTGTVRTGCIHEQGGYKV